MAADRQLPLAKPIEFTIAVGLVLLTMQSGLAAEAGAPPHESTSLLASGEFSVRLLANIAVISTCILIIVGGLWVFHWRRCSAEEMWGPISVQTLGTIFFFPTLILLAVYLELPKDAITTILGAFMGYLFGRGSGNSTSGRAGDVPLGSESGPPVIRPSSGAELREPEDEPAGTPARAAPEPPQARAA